MNPIVSVIGLVAAAVGITVSVPQVWRLWRGTTAAGVSHASAVLGVMAGSTWLTYGLLIVDHAQILANIPGLAGGLAILVLVLRRGRLSPRPAIIAAATWASVIAITYSAFGATAVGFAATAVTLVARGPQVWTAFRAPSLEALSPATFTLSTIASTLWMTYGFGTADPPVWTSSLAVIAMSVAILARYHVTARRPELLGPAPVEPSAGPVEAYAGRVEMFPVPSQAVDAATAALSPSAEFLVSAGDFGAPQDHAALQGPDRPVPAVPRPGGPGDPSRLAPA